MMRTSVNAMKEVGGDSDRQPDRNITAIDDCHYIDSQSQHVYNEMDAAIDARRNYCCVQMSTESN